MGTKMVVVAPKPKLARKWFRHFALALCLVVVPIQWAGADGDVRLSHRWWVDSVSENRTLVVVALTLHNASGQDITSATLTSSDSVFLLCGREPVSLSDVFVAAGTSVERRISLACEVDPEPLLWGQPLMFRLLRGASDFHVLSTLERGP